MPDRIDGEPSQRFMHMLKGLLEFYVTVQHRLGKQNVVANMLSRLASATVLPSDDLSQLLHDDPECAGIHTKILYDFSAMIDFGILDELNP